MENLELDHFRWVYDGINEIIFIISKKINDKKYFYSDSFYKRIIRKDPRIINEHKKT